MKIISTPLEGCFILEPTVFSDDRGYFYEPYNQQRFEEGIGQKVQFVQDNQSFSKYGVIRGLHYQVGDYAQAKLVRVISGKVLDVVVDIRKGSPSFAKHFALELSAENKKQLFIPRGFAHGFVTLSETAEFFYKCDNVYHKNAEQGIIYNDITLNIDWKISTTDSIVSPKDALLPPLDLAVL